MFGYGDATVREGDASRVVGLVGGFQEELVMLHRGCQATHVIEHDGCLIMSATDGSDEIGSEVHAHHAAHLGG